MKLKIRFQGWLLPFLKQINYKNILRKAVDDCRLNYYAAGLFVLWLLVLLLCAITANAQPEGIQVGRKVPDVTIDHILNYKSPSAKLSDFKGKLLILDFWATWCAGCVLNLPKMEALQAKFGDRIQILAVTYQDRQKIETFIKTKTDVNGKPFHFPSVVDDQQLSKLFPHHGIPHLVWIDGNGRVNAITDAEEVNEKNISKVLNQQQLNVTEKVDLNAANPLFAGSLLKTDSLSFYSVFLKGHYSGLTCGPKPRERNGILYGEAFTNSYLEEIYINTAYALFERNHETFSSRRLIISVADPSKIIRDKKPDGFPEIAEEYNYDFQVPYRMADSLFSYLLDGLNKYTEYFARIEKREVPCLVLTRTDSVDRLRSKGGDTINTLFSTSPRFQNCPLAYLVNNLNELKTIKYPVVDETGYHQNADLVLSQNPDLPNLNIELKAYGLRLVPSRRVLSMFVISDRHPKLTTLP